MLSMSECPNCHQETKHIRSSIIRGDILTGCDNCFRGAKPAEFAAKSVRKDMVDRHRKDMLQRYEPGGRPNTEWIRSYPEQAREQFTDDELRQYG